MGKPGQKLAKAHRSISLRIPGPARRSSGNRPTIAIAHQQKRNDRPMTGHLLEDLNPGQAKAVAHLDGPRSEEHTSELQSLMRTSYAVFCLKKKKNKPKSTNAH